MANDEMDSSSDSNDDSETKVAMVRAKQLERILTNNKYIYEVHDELVAIYKSLGDLDSLRSAFKSFHECYPLTPALWMEWINVEKNLATTAEQHEHVFELFQQAVDDYLSVELWSEYAQFAIGASTLERTRSVLEAGISKAGLVCCNGSLLWATYREIENLHVSMHKEGSEEWKKQLLALADVFKRELSVPLIDMESTYEEWKEWVKTLPEGLIDSKSVEYGYNKAKKDLEVYKPFEERLLTPKSNHNLLAIYQDYISHVSDPSTVMCLFERAVAQLCLTPELWLSYCSYMLKFDDLILPVCNRALRNCPLSDSLWAFKVKILEHLKKEDSTILECLEEGISYIAPNFGLELWLAYLEYSTRNSQSKEILYKRYNQAIEQLELGTKNEPQCKVSRLFSRILYKNGDKEEARKLWKQILFKSPNKDSAILWLEYANLEKQYGDPQTLRSVFQKAVNSMSVWPQFIIDEWQLHERHTGTLEEVTKCLQKCSEAVENFQKAKLQPSTSKWPKKSENLGKGTKRKTNTESSESDSKRIKSQSEGDTKTIKLKVEKNPETTVFISNLLPSVNEEMIKKIFPNAVNLVIVMDKRGKSRCFGFVQFKTSEEMMVALARDREPLDGRPVYISEIKTDKSEKKPVFKYAATEEKNKLFIRGLPVKKTKEEIEEIFSKFGAVNVRLVLHKSGQPKGLAYVEFENESQATKAMKETDQTTIDGHVITVAISSPPPKQDKFKSGVFDKKGEDEPLRSARSKLQTSMLPRTLMQAKQKEGNGESANNGVEEEPKMKSNSDFRAMLLKK
ncbi:squamous cell carcinoma antigen recognized by T-cells 3 [Euwallacea fornicatus]|uniref:squamous cell carcinoma antigen recognized by T-cells 3 n=1 Tax=Euwallacea fornicatus TaxID=995702 RepID=UPI00338DAD2D